MTDNYWYVYFDFMLPCDCCTGNGSLRLRADTEDDAEVYALRHVGPHIRITTIKQAYD